MAIEPLGYRAYQGPRRGAALRFLPIARSGLRLVLRRRILWIFLFFSLASFLFHAAVIYLIAQVEGRLGRRLPGPLAENFVFTGRGDAYMQFISLQGTVMMMLLALAGQLLVGSDFLTGAMPFYLSKAIGRREYFLGKLLAVSGLAASITLLPALVLFLEYGAFTESFDYYADNLRLLGAIAGYGAIVSFVPALFLLALASLLKRTIPITIAWAGLFAFLPAAVEAVRGVYRRRGLPDPWAVGLLDFWADLRWTAQVLFGTDDPAYWERLPFTLSVLAVGCLLSLVIFWRRISAVEVVR
jgi:ABC-2 type transport system permease protein